MIPILDRLIQIIKKNKVATATSIPKNELESIIRNIQSDISKAVEKVCTEKFDVCWYGAFYIHPKHLVYWIYIQTDSMKKELEANKLLLENIRLLLEKHNYPLEGRSNVLIGFESQETVDRESNGNWYHHFK